MFSSQMYGVLTACDGVDRVRVRDVHDVLVGADACSKSGMREGRQLFELRTCRPQPVREADYGRPRSSADFTNRMVQGALSSSSWRLGTVPLVIQDKPMMWPVWPDGKPDTSRS